MGRSLMQILGLIFAKMHIFSTQTLLCTWKVKSKSRWSGVITAFEVILICLLKGYYFEGVTSIFRSYPPHLCHSVIFLVNSLPPRRVTHFLNGPLSTWLISRVLKLKLGKLDAVLICFFNFTFHLKLSPSMRIYWTSILIIWSKYSFVFASKCKPRSCWTSRLVCRSLNLSQSSAPH